MRALLLSAILAAGCSFGAYAQTAEVTATCKDGTSWSGPTRRGACSGHQGVQTFGTGPASPAGASVANPLAPSATPPATAPRAHQPPAIAAAPAGGPTATQVAPVRTPPTDQARQAAAGGGVGKVWVNASTKVYHCPGDRYYGKTDRGSYMTETAARAAGDRPSHGKACS